MVRRKKKKLTEIAFDIYRELYANSEPKADFDLLLESAEIMLDGKKISIMKIMKLMVN